MKNFTILLTMVLLSCGSFQKKQKTALYITDGCPDQNACFFEILDEKKLVILKDELGQQYIRLEENTDTQVIHITYEKKGPENTVDGDLREELFFEIDKNAASFVLSGHELQQTKMILSRQCFCRGEAGSFIITEGTLKYIRESNQTSFFIDFHINSIPHVLSSISIRN